MNRNRWLWLGAGALILSLISTFLIYRSMVRRLRPPEENKQIVVATEKLTLGTKLSKTNVRLAGWPKSIPLEGDFTDVGQVSDRIVLTTLFPNEPVLDAKLAPKESGAGLASVIPDGMRAMSVKVNDVIGVAGFVLPGTHVDVIMTGSPKDNEEEASKVILENVQVAAAGQNIDVDANGKPQNVQVVTLLVSPEQAQDLALAQGNGRIQLALRNPLDKEHKNPAAVLRTSLFFGKKPPESPPKRAIPRTQKVQPAPVVVAPPPAQAPYRYDPRGQEGNRDFYGKQVIIMPGSAPEKEALNS